MTTVWTSSHQTSQVSAPLRLRGACSSRLQTGILFCMGSAMQSISFAMDVGSPLGWRVIVWPLLLLLLQDSQT